jgi:hypothetical protein
MQNAQPNPKSHWGVLTSAVLCGAVGGWGAHTLYLFNTTKGERNALIDLILLPLTGAAAAGCMVATIWIVSFLLASLKRVASADIGLAFVIAAFVGALLPP